MPDGVFQIPSFLSGRSLFGTFIVSLIVFHALFLFVWPLTKRGWKIVDYVWLLSGGIGLVGTTFQARQILATSMLPTLELLVSSSTDPAVYYAKADSYEGLFCRKFVRSPLSPPEEEFKRAQKEYDDACAWAKDVATRINGIERWSPIDVANLPKPPKTTEIIIQRSEQEMYKAFDDHNAIVQRRQALQSAAKRSDLEEFLAIIAPVMLIIALAMRITKVTGELRLE